MGTAPAGAPGQCPQATKNALLLISLPRTRHKTGRTTLVSRETMGQEDGPKKGEGGALVPSWAWGIVGKTNGELA